MPGPIAHAPPAPVAVGAARRRPGGLEAEGAAARIAALLGGCAASGRRRGVVVLERDQELLVRDGLRLGVLRPAGRRRDRGRDRNHGVEREQPARQAVSGAGSLPPPALGTTGRARAPPKPRSESGPPGAASAQAAATSPRAASTADAMRVSRAVFIPLPFAGRRAVPIPAQGYAPPRFA